jgi:hypothetical protein
LSALCDDPFFRTILPSGIALDARDLSGRVDMPILPGVALKFRV